jgi:hypothetical protein
MMDERHRADEILALVNAQKGGWTFLTVIGGGPAIGSDKRVIEGVFERDGSQISVSVEVHQLTSVALAKRFVACRSPAAAGWSRKRYDLADESCISEHTPDRYEISFRLRNFGGKVSGGELGSVERIARILVDYVARSGKRLHLTAGGR